MSQENALDSGIKFYLVDLFMKPCSAKDTRMQNNYIELFVPSLEYFQLKADVGVIIQCRNATDPVFLMIGKNEEFYTHFGPSWVN